MSTPGMSTGHYDQGDLALFAMQLLPREEHDAMQTHIAGCDYCRQELASLQGDLAAYAHTVELYAPSAIARERLLNQVAREKRLSPIEHTEPERIEPLAQQSEQTPTQRPDRTNRIEAAKRAPLGNTTRREEYAKGLGRGSGRSLETDDASAREQASLPAGLFARVFPWIGWAAAAGLAIAAGNLYHEREAQRSRLAAQAGQIDRLSSDAAAARQLLETITDPSARQVTLSRATGTPAPPVPQGRATYVAAKGALIFLASNLEPIETNKTYELWLIPADGRDPIPAGTFHPDTRGNASVVLPPLPKGIAAKAFGVTIEDDGGSQVPTMPIVLAGS